MYVLPIIKRFNSECIRGAKGDDFYIICGKNMVIWLDYATLYKNLKDITSLPQQTDNRIQPKRLNPCSIVM